MLETWKQWEGQTVVSLDDENIHFQLGAYLGGPAYGPVFLADAGTEPGKAAIKLLITHPGSHDEQIARWRKAAKLSHPHLLRLSYTGRCRMGSTEVLFAAMEYAEEDLSQILPERPLSPAETLDLLKPTLEALAYLHSQGFVHGHLKPANIMAVRDQLKISSDGLYLAGDQAGGQDRSPYDPPEMHGAERATGLSPAADAWALGITLAEILTQQRPCWQKDDQQDPILTELPQPFFDIIRNCLRRDPQQRWTIDQIIARLQPKPVAVAQPIAPPQSIASPKKTSKALRYAIPGVAVIFAAVLVAGLGMLRRQPQSTPAPPLAQHENTAQVQPASLSQPPTAVTSTQSISEADAAQKPSPATPVVAQRGDNGLTARTVEASLPAGPVVQPVTATSSDSKTDDIVQKVLPDVPQKARDTIQGRVKVKVRVRVDNPGDVTQAELDSPSTSQYFARLAVQAAQRWKFVPASQGGEREWLLRFEFGSEETKVFTSRER